MTLKIKIHGEDSGEKVKKTLWKYGYLNGWDFFFLMGLFGFVTVILPLTQIGEFESASVEKICVVIALLPIGLAAISYFAYNYLTKCVIRREKFVHSTFSFDIIENILKKRGINYTVTKDKLRQGIPVKYNVIHFNIDQKNIIINLENLYKNKSYISIQYNRLKVIKNKEKKILIERLKKDIDTFLENTVS